jgi:hypothetical protein
MAILHPMNFRVQILVTTGIFYTAKLFHPQHGVFQREFKSYSELEQTMSSLLIDPDLLHRARMRFDNGYTEASLGEHTFIGDDLERYQFQKEIKASVNSQSPHPYERAPEVGERVGVQGQGLSTFEVKLVDFKTKTFDAVEVVTNFPIRAIPWGAIRMSKV